jgi:hypothetical protein
VANGLHIYGIDIQAVTVFAALKAVDLPGFSMAMIAAFKG